MVAAPTVSVAPPPPSAAPLPAPTEVPLPAPSASRSPPEEWTWDEGRLNRVLGGYGTIPKDAYGRVSPTRVTAGALIIKGGFSADEAQARLNEQGQRLARCYAAGLKVTPTLTGELYAEVEVTAEEGNVVAVYFDGDASLKGMADCLADGLRAIRYPDTSAITATVGYTLHFASK